MRTEDDEIGIGNGMPLGRQCYYSGSFDRIGLGLPFVLCIQLICLLYPYVMNYSSFKQ